MLRRALVRTLDVVALAIVTLAALVFAILFHLDTRPGLALVRWAVPTATAGAIRGAIDVRKLGGIGPRGLHDVELRILAPDGRTLVWAEGVDVVLDVPAVVRGALFGVGPLDVRVDAITARHLSFDASAHVAADGSSTLAIVDAFAAKVPAPAPAPPSPTPTIVLSAIRVQHAWIYGSPADGVSIDADLGSLEAAFALRPSGVSVALDGVAIVERALVPGATLSTRAVARAVVPNDGSPSARATATGDVAGVPFVLDAELLAKHFAARVRAPDARAVGKLVPAFAPRSGVAAIVEARGELEGPFVLRAGVGGEGGNVTVLGRGTLAEPVTVDARLVASAIDVGAFMAAPTSRLDLAAGAHATLAKGKKPFADAHVVLRGGALLDGQPLPPMVLDATLEPTGDVVADLVASEAGAPTRVHASLAPSGRLAFSSDTRVSLAAFARVPSLGRGTGTIGARGTLDLRTLALDADATVRADDLAVGGVEIAKTTVDAHVSGSAKTPRVHVDVGVRRVRAFGTRAIGRLDSGADVAIGDGIRVSAAHVDARSRGETLRIVVPSAFVRGGTVRMQDAHIEGLGASLACDVVREGTSVTAAVRGHGLDLARVGRLVEDPSLRGTIDVDARARIAGKELDGDVVLDLRDGALPGLARANARIDASLHDRRGHVHADVDLGDVLTTDLRADDLVLHGPALTETTWLGAEGSAYLVATADLARLHEVVPALDGLPARLVGGRGRVRGGFFHGHDGRYPSVDVAVDTRGLAIATAGAQAPSVTGLDVGLEARVDGTTGFTALSGRITDATSTIVRLDGKAEVPLDAALEGGADLGPWRDRAIAFRVTAPERKIADLDAFLGPTGLGGRAAADVVLEGSLAHPRLRVDTAVRELRLRGASVAASVDSRLVYDGSEAKLDTTVAAGSGTAKLGATARFAIDDLLRGEKLDALPWSAKARLALDALPLAMAPGAREARLGGTIGGTVTLDDYHRDAALAADLAATGVVVGDARVPTATLRARVGKGDAIAEAIAHASDGSAEVSGSAKVAWGARLVPAVDATRALEGRFVAKAFRAAIVAPFVTSVAADLDGRIDADARIRADTDGSHVTMTGGLVARDFSFVLAALGQEYRDVGATVRFAPGGIVTVEKLHLSDGSGRLDGAAVARFDDLAFVGANATLRIDKDAPLDIVTEGQSLGDAYGDIRITARNRRRDRALDVDVDIPSLHVKLTETAGKRVQELKARPDVHVGFDTGGTLSAIALTRARVAPEAAAEERDGTTTNVVVRLGKDVELRRGQKIAVTLTGAPEAKIANGKTQVSGQIQLTGGAIDLSGRKFAVERGTVTFGADTTNPVVVATATWTAADKSRVFADFVGPVKSGKLTLRSEPARTPSEILTLLAFGSTDGPSDAPSARRGPSQGTQVATALGGGALTEGFDAAIDGVTGIETQTRIDSTNANNPRPELEVAVSRDVSIRFSYVLGTPPPSEPDKSLGTIILRVSPNWSFSTTVGDKGKGTLDTMWQYRY